MRKCFFTKLLASAAVMLSALFVGCNTEDVTFDSPEIVVSQSVITDAAQSGGIVSFTVETNRAWRVVVPDDVDWIMPEFGFASGEGSGTVKLALLPNMGFDREATVKISTSTVYSAVRIIQPGLMTKTDLYSDNFNNGTVVIADKGSMPIADYTGWNKQGPGSANVTYSGTSGATVRYTSTVAPSPSTPNDIYFASSGGDFIVSNIGKGSATNLTAEFQTASYNPFAADQMTVWVSTAAAPTVWTEAKVSRASSVGGNKWIATKAEFTVDASATQINLKFSGKDIRLFSINLWAEGIIDMPKIPVVTTNDATQITKTSATVTALFTYDGVGVIDEAGVAYCSSSTSPQQFTNVAATPKPAPGAIFTVALTSLDASTEYLYKSYVKIGTEYYYGQQKSFSTELGGTLLFDETFGTAAASESPYPSIVDYASFAATGAGASTVFITGTVGAAVENVSVRTPSAAGESKGYPGASGKSSAYFGGAEAVMYVYNIGIAGQTALKLTFGATCSTGSGSWEDNILVISYSTDNITWKPITYTRSETGLGWALTTANINIDAASDVVSLKFAAGTAQIRIDDIVLTCVTEGIAPAAGVKMTGASVSDLEITTATALGTYIAAGGTPTQTGVYYRKVSDTEFINVATSGTITSPISVALSGLTAQTDYIFTPYAVVGQTRYFGPATTFKTKSAAPASLITIAALRAKPIGPISANEKIEGVVISDKSTLSIDPKSLVIQSGTDVNSGITVRFDVAHSFEMGDRVSVFIDEGKLSKYNDLLQFTPKSDAEVTKIGTDVLPTPVVVTTATLNTHQSMLVKVENCQVIFADKDKAISTSPEMIKQADGSFEIYVASGALFKADLIPSGMGAAIGIASINKSVLQLSPRDMADLVGLTGTRFITYGKPVFSATTFKVGEAIAAGMITIPEYDAVGSMNYTVTVAISGEGAAGINPVSAQSVTSSQGDIVIPITGTPTTAGKVTFTITGITGLSANTCQGEVVAAGDVVYVWRDNFDNSTGNTEWPKTGSELKSGLSGSEPMFTGAYTDMKKIYGVKSGVTEPFGYFIKFGTSFEVGEIATPVLSLIVGTVNIKVSFDVVGWTATDKITVSANVGTAVEAEVTPGNSITDSGAPSMSGAVSRSVIINGATSATAVKFTSNKRILMDNIAIQIVP